MTVHRARFEAGWAAVNRGHVDSVLDLLHPEVEWDMSRAFPDGPVYMGHDGVRRFFHDVRQLWEELTLEMQSLHELGDRVVVIGHWAARSRGAAVPVRSPGGWSWLLRDGKAIRMRFFSDPEAALRDQDATDESRPARAGLPVAVAA